MTKDYTKKPILKPVSFTQNNETDLKILKFLEDNNLAFSSYVKDLIIVDMRKSKDKNEIAEAINGLTSAITSLINGNTFNIVSNNGNKTNEEDKIIIDQEKKSIIGNILNMSK